MPINAMQKPIYESFSMYHPDGSFMCHINQKRANWYVERGLADWIDDKSFKLKFEPKGKGKQDLLFYTQKVENRCVVCGDHSEDNLNKHHVVPYVFRSRFPVQYKESNHHDILVTCVDCHENYEHQANIFKAKLAKDLGLTMNLGMTPEQRHNKKVRSAQKALANVESGKLKDANGVSLIPEEKLEQLRQTANMELFPEEIEYGAVWADKIVENVLAENRLFEFVKMWRQHFLDNCNPQFLPNHWSVEHPLESSKQR
jgi:hypothetical protein